MNRFRYLVPLCLAVATFASACYGPPPKSVEATESASERGRSAGNAIDDEIIVAKVKSKLLADPDVSGLAIDVDSYKGIVTLKGFVRTGREADEAMRLARETDGVREVNSKLVLE